jgi:transposase InsO family protein
MDVKLAAAVAGSVRRGEVAAFCKVHGISRQTFYKWRSRYAIEGVDGLVERSRRPKRQPGRIDPFVEDAIVRARKDLEAQGLNAGPWTIHNELVDAGVRPPSDSTIWRVLADRGLIERQPQKRPRASMHRFRWARPNDCWQIDATHYSLADQTVVEIINIIDDHSRVLVRSLAVGSCTSSLAWTAFVQASAVWGVPARVLSDNGLAFSGKHRGREVLFERNLHTIGVHTIASSPYHPQTCGKVERFHQTLKRWLDAQPAPATIAELQTLLDTFIAYYNHRRAHRSLGRHTPADVWNASPRALPNTVEATATTSTTTIKVDHRGLARGRRWWFGVGVAHTGKTVTVFTCGTDAAVFDHDTLLATATIDPNRRYQRLTHLQH